MKAWVIVLLSLFIFNAQVEFTRLH